jgi:hypothetical protein
LFSNPNLEEYEEKPKGTKSCTEQRNHISKEFSGKRKEGKDMLYYKRE